MKLRKHWQRCRLIKRRRRDYRMSRKMRQESYRQLRREGVPVQDLLCSPDEHAPAHHPTSERTPPVSR